MSQAQAVAQVQTGLQLQLQFWQSQEALDKTLDLAGFVFMDDLVSTLSTEPFAESYNSTNYFFHRQERAQGLEPCRAATKQ